VAPHGTLKYTLDGSEPRNGIPYSGPIELGDGENHVLVFAEVQGVAAKAEFKFAARGKQGPRIEEGKPASLKAKSSKQLDSRTKAFQGLKDGKQIGITFENVTLDIGHGAKSASVTFGDFVLTAEYVEKTLTHLLESFDMHAPVTMKFSKASFPSGYDLQKFCESLDLPIHLEEVVQ
jgi:hypothetical protein